MDNLTHSLFGYLLFGNRLSILQILIFSNLPDILSLFPLIYYVTKDKIKNFREFINWDPSENYLEIYRTSHSLFFCFLVGLLTSFFTDQYFLLIGCMLSHIILDIFSHSGKWGTRIFYPFSDFHFNSFNWVNFNKNFTQYIIFLILILLGVFLKIIF